MCESPSAGHLAPMLWTHLKDHRQEVHGETFQIHHASGVELFLKLFTGFLVGCFPEYSFSGRAFKAQYSENILKERIEIGGGYPWFEDTLRCY